MAGHAMYEVSTALVDFVMAREKRPSLWTLAHREMISLRPVRCQDPDGREGRKELMAYRHQYMLETQWNFRGLPSSLGANRSLSIIVVFSSAGVTFVVGRSTTAN